MKSTVRQLVVGLTLVVGCSPRSPDVERQKPVAAAPAEPVPTEVPLETSFESFTIVDYNWEIRGYDLFHVDAKGAAMMLVAFGYTETMDGEDVLVPKWHRVDWQLTPSQRASLIERLEASRFRQLEPLYIDRRIYDGQNVEFVLETNAGEKRVKCSNAFPDEIVALRELANTLSEAKRRGLKESTEPMPRAQAEQIWKPFLAK